MRLGCSPRATVLLGVDGTAHGTREWAKFFDPNTSVQLMVIAIGDVDRIAKASAPLEAMLGCPLITFERVQICKRNGVELARPDHLGR